MKPLTPSDIETMNRRVRLLDPNGHPIRKVERYILPFEVKKGAAEGFTLEGPVNRVFRPQSVVTNTTEEGQVLIRSVRVGNMEQLMGEVDAYDWSTTLNQILYRAFLRQYGLVRATLAQVDAWCDRHEIYPPDNHKVDMVTSVAQKVCIDGRFTGKVKEGFSFQLSITGPSVAP